MAKILDNQSPLKSGELTNEDSTFLDDFKKLFFRNFNPRKRSRGRIIDARQVVEDEEEILMSLIEEENELYAYAIA